MFSCQEHLVLDIYDTHADKYTSDIGMKIFMDRNLGEKISVSSI